MAYYIKKTISGSSVTINDSAKAVFDEIKINGNVEQDGTPTPDTPQEIKTLKGWNLFDKEKLVQGTWNHTWGTMPQRVTIWSNKIKKGEKYTITNYDTTNFAFATGVSNYDGYNRQATGTDDSGWYTSKTYTITASQDGYLLVQIRRADNSNVTPNDIPKDLIQIAEGTTSLPYLPYNSIGVKRVGKNKLDLTKHTNTLASNTTITENSVTLNCTGSWQGEVTTPIYLKPNTVYTVSCDVNSNASYCLLNITGKKGSATSTNLVTNQYFNYFKNGYKFNSGDNDSWTFKIQAVGNSTGYSGKTIVVNELMVEEGTTKTAFEPYQEIIDYIDLKGNEVLTTDKIELRDNHLWLVKNWGKVVLDGSENWQLSSLGASKFYVESLIDFKLITGTMGYKPICSHFVGDEVADFENKKIKLFYANNKYIRIEDDDMPTLNDFKSWLSTNKPEVYYQLATPQEIDFGESTIKTLEGTNNVEILATLEPNNMELTYPVNNKKYREKSYSGESLYNCTLKINNVQVPMVQIEEIKIKDPIIDTNSETFYIGTFISKSLTIKFRNLDGLDIKSGNQVDLSIGQYIDSDTGYEVVPIGKFLIDDLSEDYTTSCEITCLDYAIKFKKNIDYSGALSSDGSITLDNLLKFICRTCGVEVGTFPTVNGNIATSVYDNTISGKQYISYIAELKGCNAKIGRDGKLYLIPVKSSPTATINAKKGSSWTVGEEYEITRVYYEDAIRNFEHGTATKNTLYVRSDNPYVINQTVIDNLYNAVNGFKIFSVECKNFGDLSLDGSDLVKYTIDDEEYITFYDNEITYAMTVMANVKTDIPTAQQNELVNVVGGTDEAKIRVVKTMIDQANGEISLLSEQTGALEEDYGTFKKSTNQTITSQGSSITSLQTTTKKLEKSYTTISTDFDTFVNTTYAQEVQNLQNQIDGAIQFWNGAAIPTLSNYPASNWTTEADRINHQADIYTVIVDVDGELKQGKSYRFDKVNNVWKWIELTDNELSAVQAIAQSKAKVYVVTPIPPYSVGDLWIKDNELYKCNTAKDSSGSYATADWAKATKYTDDTKANAAQTTANTANTKIDNLQIGGRNLISNMLDNWSQGNWSIPSVGEKPTLDTSYDNRISLKEKIRITPSTDYWVKLYSTKSVNVLFRVLDSDGNFLHSQIGMTNQKWTSPSNCYYVNVTIYENSKIEDISNGTTKVKIEKGNKSTDWTPAPEDMATEQEMEDTRSNLQETRTQISTINSDMDSILLKVEDVTTKTNGIDLQVSSLSTKIDQNAQDIKLQVEQLETSVKDGTEKLKNSLVTIDINGINVSTNTSPVSTKITNDTFEVDSGETRLAYFGYDTESGSTKAEMDNLTVTNYLVTGVHRFESSEDKKRTQIFYIGG